MLETGHRGFECDRDADGFRLRHIEAKAVLWQLRQRKLSARRGVGRWTEVAGEHGEARSGETL